MKLYLVQHGIAMTKAEDEARPLSSSGHDETEKVAKFLQKNADMQLNKIFHSGKLRAKETAGIFDKYLAPLGGIEETKDLAPNDNPKIWAKEVEGTDENIMLVGHMPHLAKLAAVLLCNDTDKLTIRFRNSGVVQLEKHDDNAWSIVWIITPELIL